MDLGKKISVVLVSGLFIGFMVGAGGAIGGNIKKNHVVGDVTSALKCAIREDACLVEPYSDVAGPDYALGADGAKVVEKDSNERILEQLDEVVTSAEETVYYYMGCAGGEILLLGC